MSDFLEASDEIYSRTLSASSEFRYKKTSKLHLLKNRNSRAKELSNPLEVLARLEGLAAWRIKTTLTQKMRRSRSILTKTVDVADGGGFKYFFYVHPDLGKMSNLTNIFQMG